MIQLTPHQLERARIMKAVRHAIRLKHALNADAECNERLPDLEKRIDQALLQGKEFEVKQLINCDV